MTRLFYKRLIGLLVCGCSIAISQLQAQPLLTLEEAIQLALKGNFDIQIAQNEQKVATQNYRMGKVGFLPTLDAHLNLKGNNHQQQGGPPKDIFDSTLTTGLALHWNIFNGMQSLFSYQRVGTLRQISQLDTQQTIDQKVAEVTKGYYGLALAQKKKRVVECALNIAQEELQLAQTKYEVGKCTKLDYLTAQVQYNEVQASLLLQEEAITKAKLTLRNLLGKGGLENFDIVEDIPLPSMLIWEELTQSFKSANSAILIAQKQGQEAALGVKLQKAQVWPRVDFLLGYDPASYRFDQGWKTTPKDFHYGVSVSFNIFNAFQHHRAIQEAKIKLGNAQLRLEAQQIQLENSLKELFLHYTQQLQRCTLIQQHVQVSEEYAAVALEQYHLGKITLLELEKASKSAQEASLKYWQAIYDAKTTEVELQRLCGRWTHKLED